MAKEKSGYSFHTKKELKKELAHKIETALPELKQRLGKKKFNKRIKKATRLFIKGVNLNVTDKKILASKKNLQPKKKDVVNKQTNEEYNSL